MVDKKFWCKSSKHANSIDNNDLLHCAMFLQSRDEVTCTFWQPLLCKLRQWNTFYRIVFYCLYLHETALYENIDHLSPQHWIKLSVI